MLVNGGLDVGNCPKFSFELGSVAAWRSALSKARGLGISAEGNSATGQVLPGQAPGNSWPLKSVSVTAITLGFQQPTAAINVIPCHWPP
jgi:hypothetical protein